MNPWGTRKGKATEKLQKKYYICTRNNYSRFYLSLGLSYPNTEDARGCVGIGIDRPRHL